MSTTHSFCTSFSSQTHFLLPETLSHLGTALNLLLLFSSSHEARVKMAKWHTSKKMHLWTVTADWPTYPFCQRNAKDRSDMAHPRQTMLFSSAQSWPGMHFLNHASSKTMSKWKKIHLQMPDKYTVQKRIQFTFHIIKRTWIFKELLICVTESRATIVDTRFCSPASDCTTLHCYVNQKLNECLALKPTQTGPQRMTHYP